MKKYTGTEYVDNNENERSQDTYAKRTYSSKEYYDLIKESLKKIMRLHY